MSVAVAAALGACGHDAPNLLVVVHDAGLDADDGATPNPYVGDGDVPDADPTLGGPCVDDGQCDDGVACTFDRCDHMVARCRHTPDDTQCDDHLYCNGHEICAGARGCVPGPVVTCEDGTACTIDHCDEAQKACLHAPRDLDGDGDPDDHCVAKKDCDDLDPEVSSTRSEICNNHVDDNCDGVVDEAACTTPAHDTCATALPITSSGTYTIDTAGTKHDYPISCAGYAFDSVATVTIPPGGPKDIDLWGSSPIGAALGLGVQGTCGDGATELTCNAVSSANAVRARARSLPPGTYAVVVDTSSETEVDLAVDLRDPTPKPANESCGDAQPITIGAATVVELVDASKDLASACSSPSSTGELTYSFTLASPADVRIFASTVKGTGSPIVGLRTAACSAPGDELACRYGSTLPVFARALPAGSYVVTVAASAPSDVSVTVQTSAPTAAPADQTCASPPAAAVNGTTTFDLGAHEEAIKDGCFTGGPTAAYALPLGVTSDVMVVARFPGNDPGGVSIDDPACAPASVLACATGLLPVRTNKRSVPPGDYRVVVADSLGQVGTLTTLVRPSVPPTTLSGGGGPGDTCASAVDVPATGGFFTGDTSTAQADFATACDQGGVVGGGAPDEVLRLVLGTRKRVVMSMEGSVYSTILDVRSGATCPGAEVPGACYVGFTGARSFLDLTLDAGTYWIVIDGYSNASGIFALDVRVVDP